MPSAKGFVVTIRGTECDLGRLGRLSSAILSRAELISLPSRDATKLGRGVRASSRSGTMVEAAELRLESTTRGRQMVSSSSSIGFAEELSWMAGMA